MVFVFYYIYCFVFYTQFKEAPSGKDLPDNLEKVKFSSMAWTHDHKGLLYNVSTVTGACLL